MDEIRTDPEGNGFDAVGGSVRPRNCSTGSGYVSSGAVEITQRLSGQVEVEGLLLAGSKVIRKRFVYRSI